MRNKLIFILLSSLTFFSCTSHTRVLPDKEIVVLYTNDVHCAVDTNLGYAKVAALKEQMKEETPYVTLVDAGDAIQGSIIGAISKGGHIISLMNKTGYDIAVPGNHEFDYGIPRLMELGFALKCGYISCNFKNISGRLIFEPFKMVRYGDTKVAFVGICTPESFTKSTPTFFMNTKHEIVYTFGNEKDGEQIYRDVQNAIDSARKMGADFVILVGHTGEDISTKKWSTSVILSKLEGADAYIDGHSHEEMPMCMMKDSTGKEIPVTQTGSRLENIGKLTISTDGKITTELIHTLEDKSENPAAQRVAQEIISIEESIADTINKNISFTDFPLLAKDSDHKWLVRDGETNLSDLVADSMRIPLKADIALLNGGGIRENLSEGEITYGDLLTVLPFFNTVAVYQVKGQTLLDELEFGVSKMPSTFGGFMQVSGMSYKVNTKIPSSCVIDENNFFQRVDGEYRVHEVLVNGEPLDTEKYYTVSMIPFVAESHGDGHLFKDIKRLDPKTQYQDIELLVEYTMSLGEKISETYKDPKGSKRILIENK